MKRSAPPMRGCSAGEAVGSALSAQAIRVHPVAAR